MRVLLRKEEREREREEEEKSALFDTFAHFSKKKMSEERTSPSDTADVGAVLAGIAILAFLEQLSAAAGSHHHHHHQAVQSQPPAAERSHFATKEQRRKKKLKSIVASTAAIAFRSFQQLHHQVPRHSFALPSSLLPTQPGQFDGSELVERLMALQARQPKPNFECKR